MKKTILLSIILISTIQLFAQSGKVNYMASIIKKPLDKNSPYYEKQKEIREVIDSRSKDIELEMTFNAIEAVYKKKEKLKNDNDYGVNLTALLAGADAVYYTNKKDSLCIESVEDAGQRFLVSRKLAKWKISNETKKIGKYICTKATTIKKVDLGRKIKKVPVTAWFTKEVPVSFAPKNYSGLPGLIVELQEGKLLLSVTKIAISADKKVAIKKPSKGMKVTEEEYKKIQKKLDKEDGWED